MKDFPEQPLLADIRAAFDALGGELREMVAARWELARLELHADFRSAMRLLFAWLAAAVMALTALPLLLVCLANALDGRAEITRNGWLLIFGCGLLILAMAGSLWAWRRFRRRFLGLQETLEELREDLVWLQDLGRKRTP
jgi:uncharacterized membrane protein YqjE